MTGAAKSENRTAIVDGRELRSFGHGKLAGTWEVMISDHHKGYISYEEYERIRSGQECTMELVPRITAYR